MRGFIRSFRYAFRGLRLCLLERNFRFHLVLSGYMLGYLLLYDWFTLSRAEWAALIAVTALVLIAEAFNTALEYLVDLVTTQRRRAAGAAKDIGAAAVLITAAGAVAAGLRLLYQPEAFRALAAYYAQKPWMLVVLAISLAGTGIFIFTDWKNRSKKMKNRSDK
ncbi:MAG: diacylglycerol kinase family protein [Oscillospiraceae bacterium]|nr:diacylglycerol kinase family protein [Oscillospiraceae bacterium]